MQHSPVWIRANVRETLLMAEQADDIEGAIERQKLSEGADVSDTPLKSPFHRDPSRRERRRRMILEQRGMHPR